MGYQIIRLTALPVILSAVALTIALAFGRPRSK